MKATQFLVIGGANLDITGTCHNSLLPEDSNPGVVKSAAGGVARNIAENLARLDNSSSLMTMLGDDFGRLLIVDSCQKAGIDQSNIIVDKNLSTGTYLAVDNNQGALSVAVADMAIIDHLLPSVLECHKQAFDDAVEVVIEANLPPESIQWIANHCKDKPIHADAVSATKATRLKPILNKLNTLKVNRQEAAKILDCQADDVDLAKGLYDLGVKKVLLSLGAEGAMLYSEAGAIHQQAIKTPSQSNNGSGDALFCGMITADKRLRDPADQLEFAVACATFTLGSREAVNPDLSVEAVKQQFLTHFPVGAWF